MDGLPEDLVDKVLLGIDLKSLAMVRCTSRSLRSRTYDPYFESEYSRRIRSIRLFQISSTYDGSISLSYHDPCGHYSSVRMKDKCHVLGSCSGLLLLLIDDLLCVANPLTKEFGFLRRPSRLMRAKHVGLAVNQVDRATQSFKIVHIIEEEEENTEKTRYEFEVSAGNSWEFSKTTITCRSSDLMKYPVYFEGSLHWLRNDGSIVAFNPETEQARLIPTELPQESTTMLFTACPATGLTLISATEEVIYIYTLESILGDPKWAVVKQMRSGEVVKELLALWNAYDRDVFQFTPSPSTVVGFDEMLASDDKHISSLSSIMGFIGGISLDKEPQKKKLV